MPPAEEFDAPSSRPGVEASHDPAAPPTPDAMLPPLGADQVRALHEVGREWDPASDRRAVPVPVDSSLRRHPELPQPTRWGRLVHVKPPGGAADELEATSDDDAGSDLAIFKTEGPENGEVATEGFTKYHCVLLWFGRRDA